MTKTQEDRKRDVKEATERGVPLEIKVVVRRLREAEELSVR